MKVTVGIKALNEEKHIAAALASAIGAVSKHHGEVILADSGSSDRTIEIAQQFPVAIYQLANTAERCCGAGAQLAFQHSEGEFFYLMDGDMVLHRDFIDSAVEFLEKNPEIAAVGGHVRECNTQAEEFKIRAKAYARDASRTPGIVDRLDGGGLYRTAAVREVGYFADRNLHAFEEFELGARLQAKGWKLARIDQDAIDHYGHVLGGFHLLWRRFHSGYLRGGGEIIRTAIGKPHLRIILRRLGHIRNATAVIVWWLLIILLSMSLPALALALLLAPIPILAWRRRSLTLGLYSLASWNMGAVAMLTGLFGKRTPPEVALASIALKSLTSSPFQDGREAQQ
jgi:GT2 family glycosyltransferase